MEDRERGREERVRQTVAWLRRYDGLVDDDEAFRSALAERTPPDLLVPPSRSTRAQVAGLLARGGVRAREIPWAPHHLRLEGVDGPGRLPEVAFGLAYPQGSVSGLAARLLGPEEAERVLDLCAAPGGKTLYLAALAGPGARVVANEARLARSGLVVQAMARHGVASALVVRHDGAAFPGGLVFDRILVDAPCTGEGTFRVPSPRYDPGGTTGLARARAIQRRLLARAVTMLARGGLLLYSTCSYAPEENEAVLDEVLRSADDVDVEPLPDWVPGIPAVASWQEVRFDVRVTRARRLFPHHTGGSWGFFLALLRKRGDAASTAGRTPRRPAVPATATEAGLALRGYLGERFGVDPDLLAEFRSVSRGKDVWLLTGGCDADEGVPRLRVVAPGLRALRVTPRSTRATNGVLRMLDGALERNVVELGWDEAVAWLRSGSTPVSGAWRGGQTAVRVEGTVVGSGSLSAGELRMEIPRAWR